MIVINEYSLRQQIAHDNNNNNNNNNNDNN